MSYENVNVDVLTIRRYCTDIEIQINGGKFRISISAAREVELINNTNNMTPKWLTVLSEKILEILGANHAGRKQP